MSVVAKQHEIKVGEKTVTVRHFTNREILGPAARHLSPIIQFANSDNSLIDILAFAGEDVVALCAMCTGLTTDQLFDEFETDELLAIAEKVFEVNRDFFTRKILPSLTKAGVMVPKSA